MPLNKKLIELRKNIKNNQKNIIAALRSNQNFEICIFCGTTDNLTKEHVLPQWVYKKNPKKNFVTNTNGISQTYNRSVLPCCNKCNNDILGSLESTIQSAFNDTNLSVSHFSKNELELIVLWLEVIEYKFQVMDLRREFKKHKDSDYIPFLANIPIVMLHDLSLTPAKVFSNLRKALKKISIKSKKDSLNSLLIFKTKNPDFFFFHSVNNYIYLELPEFRISLFYFFEKKFSTHQEAHNESMKIITREYQDT